MSKRDRQNAAFMKDPLLTKFREHVWTVGKEHFERIGLKGYDQHLWVGITNEVLDNIPKYKNIAMEAGLL
jgi:hypothetical protein